MTGWNMPPGVNERDIPGNRPEDQEAEVFFDAFYAAVDKAAKDNPTGGYGFIEALANWVWEKMGEAYADGYARKPLKTHKNK